MKKMTKILALVLALALVLSLGACSKKATIDGTWIYSMDLMKAMNASPDAAQMAEEFEKYADAFKDVVVKVKLDLTADGKYTFGVDEESAKEAMPKMIEGMKKILPDMLKDMLGEDVDINEFLEAQGMTMDDMLASFTEEMNTDDMAAELAEATEKGTYKFENGKLSFTPENGDAYEWAVELNGSELKVTELAGDADMIEALKGLLPLTFKK